MKKQTARGEVLRFEKPRCMIGYNGHLDKKVLAEKIVDASKYGADHVYTAHCRASRKIPQDMTWAYANFARVVDKEADGLFEYDEVKRAELRAPKLANDAKECLEFLDREDPECDGLRYLGLVIERWSKLIIWQKGFIRIISRPTLTGVINWLCLGLEIIEHKSRPTEEWYKKLQTVTPRTHNPDYQGPDWAIIYLRSNSASLESQKNVVLDSDWNRFGLIIDIASGYDISLLSEALYELATTTVHTWVICKDYPSLDLVSQGRWRVVTPKKLDADEDHKDIFALLDLNVNNVWVMNRLNSYCDPDPVPVDRTREKHAKIRWMPKEPMQLSNVMHRPNLPVRQDDIAVPKMSTVDNGQQTTSSEIPTVTNTAQDIPIVSESIPRDNPSEADQRRPTVSEADNNSDSMNVSLPIVTEPQLLPDRDIDIQDNRPSGTEHGTVIFTQEELEKIRSDIVTITLEKQIEDCARYRDPEMLRKILLYLVNYKYS